MTTIIGYVTALATEAFSIGAKVIEFVTAEGNEICLIGIAMMVLVGLTGLVTRLIKGV